MANNPISIPSGVSVIIDSGVSAPVAGNPFVPQVDPAGNDFSMAFQLTGTVTTASADLQASLDGGTTWTTFATAVLTAAAPFAIKTPLVAGTLYRFNYTAASGSITLRACSN